MKSTQIKFVLIYFYDTLFFLQEKAERKFFMEEKIRQLLSKHIKIECLHIINDSKSHHNHPEAKKSGGGHFAITVVSQDFKGKTPLERHKMIYHALKAEIPQRIHALAIKALTPEEKI